MLNKINFKSKKISSSILVIAILILVLICSFVLFFEVNDYRNIKEETNKFYYYFSESRIDFEGKISINSKNNIISLNSNNITLNTSPIYYVESNDQMILPSNMEIIYPYKNSPMYKLGPLSKIFYKGNFLYINSEAGYARLYDCFLYDGEDLYVFLEEITVSINDKKYSLGPMSFIEVTNGYIRMYDKVKDSYIFLENINNSVAAYTDEYYIDISNDSFTYKNNYYLLIKNVDGLDYYNFN